MFGLDFIKKLKPVLFKYTNDVPDISLQDDKHYFGFMAQDLEKLLPQDKYSIVKMDSSGYRTVDYIQLIAPLVKSIQELTNEVEQLKQRIKDMENINE